jgi:hypothetical protein
MTGNEESSVKVKLNTRSDHFIFSIHSLINSLPWFSTLNREFFVRYRVSIRCRESHHFISRPACFSLSLSLSLLS